MKEKVKEILLNESEAIKNIPVSDQYEKIIDLFYDKVHKKDGKLITSGMGKAGQVALNISTTFSSTGTPAFFMHPSDAQHGDLGGIQENDVLMVISNSGKTREILELVHLARNLYSNIPVVVITGNPDGELAAMADFIIFTGNPKEVCPLGLTPTTSTTAMAVIGDVLVVLMMNKINFTKEGYSKRHHGGYLGEKSRTP